MYYKDYFDRKSKEINDLNEKTNKKIKKMIDTDTEYEKYNSLFSDYNSITPEDKRNLSKKFLENSKNSLKSEQGSRYNPRLYPEYESMLYQR